MSLSIDGVWKAGVWATTVWADGVWFEGTNRSGTHDGGWVKRDNKERDKRLDEQREEARLLREQIETAYADVTGERRVPEPTEIAATVREVKAWKEPETRLDGLAYLAHIGKMLAELKEIEQHIARVQKAEDDDVAWIVANIGEYL